jgi:hypothetical protein
MNASLNETKLPMAIIGKRKIMPRTRVWGIVAICGVAAVSNAHASEPQQIKNAAEKSIALLQRCGPEFFRQSGCVACHHQTVTSLAVSEARKRGLSVDEKTAREQLQVTRLVVKSFRARFLERADHPANSAPAAGYIALGMGAENCPADENTDAMMIEMAGRQTSEGSWTAFGHRPPLEYSRISATAVAVRAMQLYGPPGLKDQFNRRIGRARDWLITAEPTSNAEHAFRLLGLAWSGADKQHVEREVSALLNQQRDDGGWAQLPSLTSDAYATGLTLYSLHTGGEISPAHPGYQRGVEYLLQTQLDDGSWHVKTRSFPFQPYFESGFPHGHDQWISASATGFAAVALMYTIPSTVAGGQ